MTTRVLPEVQGSFRPGGDPLGLHRVVQPVGVLPQAAERLDPSLPLWETEIALYVQTLNIDAASFEQLHATGLPVAEQIAQIVQARGKMQNPVTGSGGMLLGQIAAVGPKYTGPLAGQPVGTAVATLVSLTLTPLQLTQIVAVRPAAHQVDVVGLAILPSSAPAAVLPADLPHPLALAVLDVCGAPALCKRLTERLPHGGSVAILGAGKAGSLSAAALRHERPDLRLLVLDRYEAAAMPLQQLGLVDQALALDCSDALAVRDAAVRFAGGAGCDAVIGTTSLPGSEMATILACKPRGVCLFFGMATQFARVALGAEGVGADVDLLIGNGYAEGHAAYALELVRQHAGLRSLLAARLGPSAA